MANQQTNDKSGFDTGTAIFGTRAKSQNKSEAIAQVSDAVNRKRPRETLVQQIKQTMLTYESSVASFPDTLHNANDSLNLVILKCRYESVAIWTLTKDFDSKQYKWAIFKHRKPAYIRPGACVKLFQPWQQVFIPSLKDYVIICSDFSYICDPVAIGASGDVVQELLSSNAVDVKWKQFSPEFLNAYSNLVPYTVSNNSTISKQIALKKSSINLDAVVCQVWKTPESYFALVKDSDKMIAALEISSNNGDMHKALEPGRFISFSHLNILEKVTTWSYMPIFSLISLYGSKQNFCYKLGMDSNTTWKVKLLHDIPFSPTHPEQKTILEVSKMGEKDCRFNIIAKIKYLNSDQLIIWDDSTNLKGRVEIVAAFENQFHTTNTTECVQLEYIRYFRGKLSLDRFSFITSCQ